MAGIKGVSDDNIARWIFEDSEVEGEFSDESEHEETLPVCSDISASESESGNEEKSDNYTQPVTSSWKVYHDGDDDRIKLHNRDSPFLKVLGQKLNLNISSSTSQMILLVKLLPRQICMQRKTYRR
jgi:hypothetical protein